MNQAILELAEMFISAGNNVVYESAEEIGYLIKDASEFTNCDHYGVDSGGTDYYGMSNPPQESDWNYAYCPKCGVKL